MKNPNMVGVDDVQVEDVQVTFPTPTPSAQVEQE